MTTSLEYAKILRWNHHTPGLGDLLVLMLDEGDLCAEELEAFEIEAWAVVSRLLAKAHARSARTPTQIILDCFNQGIVTPDELERVKAATIGNDRDAQKMETHRMLRVIRERIQEIPQEQRKYWAVDCMSRIDIMDREGMLASGEPDEEI
jgi:hypothetical protein